MACFNHLPYCREYIAYRSVLWSEAFTRLTGYQIEEAVECATAEGSTWLAILLSQAGGDTKFRGDLEDQLTARATEGADKFVTEAYRKCMAILAGVTHVWHVRSRRDTGATGPGAGKYNAQVPPVQGRGGR